MASETHKAKLAALDFVDEKQVRQYVAFPVGVPLALECMVPVLRGDAETGHKQTDHLVGGRDSPT